MSVIAENGVGRCFYISRIVSSLTERVQAAVACVDIYRSHFMQGWQLGVHISNR